MERDSGVPVKEPEIQKAFEYRTRMNSGVIIGVSDVSIELWDLLGVLEEEQARIRKRKQKELEAGSRRIQR